MSKERQTRGSESKAQPQSLRDYWNNPTSHPASPSAKPHRRNTQKPQLTTPSSWEPNVLQSQAVLQKPPDEVSGLTRSVSPSDLAERKIAEVAFVPQIVEPGTDRRKHLIEQIEMQGTSTLSTTDLFSLFLQIEAGNEKSVPKLERLLEQYSLSELLQTDFGEISEQYGLGKDNAAKIQAVLELSRRLLTPTEKKYQIRSAIDVVKLVAPDMAYLDHEELRGLYLDTKNQVVANLLLYKGTANNSVLRNAEILRPAVTRNCPNIVLAHNHPSGIPEESPEDIAITLELVEGAKLLDIQVLDHIIIGTNGRFVSLKEKLRW